MTRSSWMMKMLFPPSRNVQDLKSRSLLCEWGGSQVTLCVSEQCRSSRELIQLRQQTICSANCKAVFQVCSCCSTMLAGAQGSLASAPFPVSQLLLSYWTAVLSISALCLQAQHPVSGRKKKQRNANFAKLSSEGFLIFFFLSFGLLRLGKQ